MNFKMPKFFSLTFILLITLCFVSIGEGAYAQDQENKLGVLPPDYDFTKICKKETLLEEKLKSKYQDETDFSKFPQENLLEFAKFYYRGDGKSPPDYDRALQLINYIISKDKSADNTEHYIEASFLKYEMYVKGQGIDQNNLKAKEILDELILVSPEKAYSRYGDLYVTEGLYSDAVESYRKAIALGQISPTYNLARLYYNKNLPATQEQINNYIILAQNAGLQLISRGNCDGLMMLALLYEQMNDIPNAEYYSVKWFEKAATLDIPLAKMYLASLIQRGFAIKKPFSYVVKLWHEAADLGHPRAMYNIGDYELSNAKTIEEKQQAIYWLEKSSRYHFLKATEALANIYEGKYGIEEDLDKRQYWLEQAVKQKSNRASTYVELAKIYALSDQPDYDVLFDLYQTAANLGDDNAFIKLGDYYRYGIGREAQPTKALRYYRLAASNLKTSAMKAIREAYTCQIGKAFDKEKVEFWNEQILYFSDDDLFETAYIDLLSYPTDNTPQIKEDLDFSATAKSNESALIYLGLYALKEGNKKQSKNLFEKALFQDLQNSKKYKSHYLLGRLYLKGEVIEKNEEYGVELLTKASDSGHESAYNLLGIYYKDKNNFDLAKKYLEKASRQGKNSAFIELADIYEKNDDLEAAIKALKKAALKNDVEAMLLLADIYSKQEKNIQSEPINSQLWFSKAINSNPCDLKVILKIVKSYKEGINGAPKDDQKMYEWLSKVNFETISNENEKFKIAEFYINSDFPERADKKTQAILYLENKASEGDQLSIELLASYYLIDPNDSKNIGKAIGWLEKSANNGNIDSMMALANLYISGFNVDPSKDKAIFWLQKAKDKGNIKASNLLDIMFNN